MSIINLTPHAVVVRTPQGDVTFPPPPKGQECRVQNTPGKLIRTLDNGVPVYEADVPGKISGLPEPDGCTDSEMTCYLISVVVAGALSPERRAVGDCLVPGTGSVRFPFHPAGCKPVASIWVVDTRGVRFPGEPLAFGL